MKKSTLNYLEDTRHYWGFVYCLLGLEVELGKQIPCKVKLLKNKDINLKEFINTIRNDWFTSNSGVLKNELDIIYTQCNEIVSIWNHVKHLEFSNFTLIYGEQDSDFKTPMKNIFIRNDSDYQSSICKLDSISLDTTSYQNIEYFHWENLDSNLHTQMNEYLQASDAMSIILESVICDCMYVQKHLGELLNENIKDDNYLEIIELIDKQLLDIYTQSFDLQIEFKQHLKKLLRYTDKLIVIEKLRKYILVFGDLYKTTNHYISKITDIQLSKDSKYFLIDVIHSLNEKSPNINYQYKIESKDKDIETLKYDLNQNKIYLPTYKVDIYTHNEEVINFYNREYLCVDNWVNDLSRTFIAQASRINIHPLPKQHLTFEEYCLDLLSSKEKINRIISFPQYTTFKDTFICEDRYNKAMTWLEREGHIINNYFTKAPKYIAFLIKSLEFFGYIETVSIYTKENISIELNKKYSNSSFANFNKKNYTLEELQNYNINIFAKLPIYKNK